MAFRFLNAPSWWIDPTPRHAYILSLASLIITVFAAVLGIIGYSLTKSSLLLCYGLENVVDFLSSAVVLWRFFQPGDSPERVLVLKKREKRASVAISVILLILGIAIVAMAMIDFREKNEVFTNMKGLLALSFVSSIIFFMLTVVKIQMASVLSSRALMKDGYCSLIGCVLATTLFLNSVIIIGMPSLWWLDPMVSLIVGLVAMFFGVRSILIQGYEKKIPIYNPRWWFISQGNVTLSELRKMDEDEAKQQELNENQNRKAILTERASSNSTRDLELSPVVEETGNEDEEDETMKDIEIIEKSSLNVEEVNVDGAISESGTEGKKNVTLKSIV